MRQLGIRHLRQSTVIIKRMRPWLTLHSLQDKQPRSRGRRDGCFPRVPRCPADSSGKESYGRSGGRSVCDRPRAVWRRRRPPGQALTWDGWRAGVVSGGVSCTCRARGRRRAWARAVAAWVASEEECARAVLAARCERLTTRSRPAAAGGWRREMRRAPEAASQPPPPLPAPRRRCIARYRRGRGTEPEYYDLADWSTLMRSFVTFKFASSSSAQFMCIVKAGHE